MQHVVLDKAEIIPSKIVCIGRNYVDHIKELDNTIPAQPIVFIKPNSAISNDLYFSEKEAIHFEGEITFLVRDKKLYAVGFGFDLTKRDLQEELKTKGLPWERAKAFNKSAVFSEFVRFDGKLEDLRLELYKNGVLTQKADYELMLNKPDAILTEVNTFLNLEDGDLIMTGTPKGVGPINVGDEFTGKIFDSNQLLVESSWVVL